MEYIAVAVVAGAIAGIIYYIIRRNPPGGGFRGGFA